MDLKSEIDTLKDENQKLWGKMSECEEDREKLKENVIKMSEKEEIVREVITEVPQKSGKSSSLVYFLLFLICIGLTVSLMKSFMII